MPKKTVLPSIEPSPVWLIPEVARYYNAPIYAIRQLIRRGRLPYQRIGKRFVVPVAAAKAYLQDNWITEGAK